MIAPRLLLPIFCLVAVKSAFALPETLRLPLSGQGPADAVEWDFQVSDGRRAGGQAQGCPFALSE